MPSDDFRKSDRLDRSGRATGAAHSPVTGKATSDSPTITTGATSASPQRILIVAAEASSCLYAQRLLQHWKQHNISVEAFGIGDQGMADEGFHCLARAEDLAVVGIQEVIAHWPVIKKAFHDLMAAAEERKPKVVLLLDYPGFNLRFAEKVKTQLGLPVVYYISPQVWAWKEGRVKTIRKFIDELLVVFPFEVPFYEKHNMKVHFVGHPLLDEIKQDHGAMTRELRRAKYGVGPDDVLLALMPGSRKSELKHHLTVQLQAAKELRRKQPNLKVALLVAPNFSLEQMRDWLDDLDFPLILIKDEPFSMIDLTDVVLCASGTATLIVGLCEKPMVIMYRMNPMTAFLAKLFVKSTKYFGLINLVLDQLAVPELFQEKAGPAQLVAELEPMLTSEELRKAYQQTLRPAKDRLGTSGATKRVAEALEKYWS
jgi:lipid-A-disaccharide synthase